MGYVIVRVPPPFCFACKYANKESELFDTTDIEIKNVFYLMVCMVVL